MSGELTKRVGYITGRLADIYPDYRVTSRPLPTGATRIEVWDEGNARYLVDHMLTNTEITQIVDVDILVDHIVRRAQP